MQRPVTLFTGQWADLPLAELLPKAEAMGYDGLELACWGDHFDVARANAEPTYARQQRDRLAEYGLELHAISNHLVGQAVCDPIDERHKAILPARLWKTKRDGTPDAEAVRQRAAVELGETAKAAARAGISIVNGFTGSAVWHMLYPFPPTSQKLIDAGYSDFAKRFGGILKVFKEAQVRFALEVHPTEIAYDIETAHRALEAIDGHPNFGFNFDPSHLLWQGIDPVAFVRAFPDRIFHVHMKDVSVRQSGTQSVLGGHLSFGDHRRGWDFRSVGRGDVDFDAIIRELNRVGYAGPLSVEWEDPDMDREQGATESCQAVHALQFAPAQGAFDAAFAKKASGTGAKGERKPGKPAKPGTQVK